MERLFGWCKWYPSVNCGSQRSFHPTFYQRQKSICEQSFDLLILLILETLHLLFEALLVFTQQNCYYAAGVRRPSVRQISISYDCSFSLTCIRPYGSGNIKTLLLPVFIRFLLNLMTNLVMIVLMRGFETCDDTGPHGAIPPTFFIRSHPNFPRALVTMSGYRLLFFLAIGQV